MIKKSKYLISFFSINKKKEAELNEQEADIKKKPFIKMNFILNKLKEREIEPALE